MSRNGINMCHECRYSRYDVVGTMHCTRDVEHVSEGQVVYYGEPACRRFEVMGKGAAAKQQHTERKRTGAGNG